MKYKLLMIFFSIVIFSFTKSPEYVYICKGPSSKVYHRSEHCRGLSHCSTRIYKVTLEESKKLNRRPCRIEY